MSNVGIVIVFVCVVGVIMLALGYYRTHSRQKN